MTLMTLSDLQSYSFIASFQISKVISYRDAAVGKISADTNHCIVSL